MQIWLVHSAEKARKCLNGKFYARDSYNLHFPYDRSAHFDYLSKLLHPDWCKKVSTRKTLARPDTDPICLQVYSQKLTQTPSVALSISCKFMGAEEIVNWNKKKDIRTSEKCKSSSAAKHIKFPSTSLRIERGSSTFIFPYFCFSLHFACENPLKIYLQTTQIN